MTVSFNIPESVEQAILGSGGELAAELKEAALVELYRMGRISHGQLAEGLGLSRPEADAVLKRHGVVEDLLTSEELDDQIIRLRKLAG
jgi:predicted HTH domain antitoxin